MTEIQNSPPSGDHPKGEKQYDLEDRTREFARKVFDYCKILSKDIVHFEIAKQLVRSGGSVGANYIEANESLGKKDFLMRIRICRKEAKESRYWLFLTEPNEGLNAKKNQLIQESTELTKIFGSILEKSK